MIRAMLLAVLCCVGCTAPCAKPSASGDEATTPPIEATSLLGHPLVRPATTPEEAAKHAADIAAARSALDAAPASESAAIWYGRRLAYAGRYQDSIAAFTWAIALHPESYRLLRHRGHRYITTRQFDLAIADLTLAQTLMMNHPDALEPDGIPGPAGPRSTDRSNIYYHLALAYYLTGDYAAAAATFAKRRGIEPFNDDMLVSTVHWEYCSLRRLGREADAAAALAPIRPGLDVRENASYYDVCLMYTGRKTPEEISPADAASPTTPTNASIAYGIANWHLLHNDPPAAAAMMQALTQSPNWASFGVIAAEADLARNPALRPAAGVK